MRKNSKNLMTWSALSALTSMFLVPMLNNRTRKRVTRSARNAYFRMSDFIQDVMDMRNNR